MLEISSVDHIFHRIHLLIAEGQEDKALAALEQVPASNAYQRREAAYLRAWCATLSGHWDAAAALLSGDDGSGQGSVDLQGLGQTERRRRAHYLLVLGQTASELGQYEEATRHYTQCIKFLDERRMNISSVRIKACCGLGAAYTQTGFYTLALTQYEDALHLSSAGSAHSKVLDIYVGLCDVHRCLGHFGLALTYGKRALQLCGDRADTSLEGCIHTLLGRVCTQMHAFQEAASHYTEALELAKRVHTPVLILTNLIALVTVRMEEGLLDEAQCLYEQALECLPYVSDAHLMGALYMVGGQLAEASQSASEHAGALLEEAIACYRKAEAAFASIQARAELAEVYGRLAQIFEAADRQNEAIACWKSAYTLYVHSEEYTSILMG